LQGDEDIFVLRDAPSKSHQFVPLSYFPADSKIWLHQFLPFDGVLIPGHSVQRAGFCLESRSFRYEKTSHQFDGLTTNSPPKQAIYQGFFSALAG
jgi:hypothetical protein